MQNNKEVIEILEKEKRELYPYGLLLISRGSGKTDMQSIHFLRYVGYIIVIDEYKNIDREVTLKEAHNEINDFVVKMMNEYKTSEEITEYANERRGKAQVQPKAIMNIKPIMNKDIVKL